jgi:membrane-associated protein
MESLLHITSQYATHAHWFIFAAIILAGANLPLSIDLLALIAALLASQVVPENTLELFLSVYLGCLFSAWVSYWIGRLLGPKLYKWRLFAALLNPNRLTKIKSFYARHGLLTLILGRFIPFGVRNCLFMTAGISEAPFRTFLWRDFIACSVWSSVAFYLFYSLGQNYEVLSQHLKTINCLIFVAFSVTVISVIWYKKGKRAKSKTAERDLNR